MTSRTECALCDVLTRASAASAALGRKPGDVTPINDLHPDERAALDFYYIVEPGGRFCHAITGHYDAPTLDSEVRS